MASSDLKLLWSFQAVWHDQQYHRWPCESCNPSRFGRDMNCSLCLPRRCSIAWPTLQSSIQLHSEHARGILGYESSGQVLRETWSKVGCLVQGQKGRGNLHQFKLSQRWGFLSSNWLVRSGASTSRKTPAVGICWTGCCQGLRKGTWFSGILVEIELSILGAWHCESSLWLVPGLQRSAASRRPDKSHLGT